MTRKAIALIVAGVVAVAVLTVVLASSLGGSDAAATHSMPDGRTMQGESMQGMPGGSSTDGMEEMPDGSSMGGMEH